MNPFNKLPLLTKRMNEIIDVQSIEWLTTDADGTVHYSATAVVADMRELRPAIYHPADLAEPAELGPGLCTACFELEPDVPQPPFNGTQHDQIEFLYSLGIDWQIGDNH